MVEEARVLGLTQHELDVGDTARPGHAQTLLQVSVVICEAGSCRGSLSIFHQ